MDISCNWLFGGLNGRRFEPPQTINEAVAGHHRMLMVTVLGLITSLAITSNSLTIWQHLEGHRVSVCQYPPQGAYNVEVSEDQKITGAEKEYLCGRGREGNFNNMLRNNNRRIWAEALPEATCVWCLFVWLITFPLLYVGKEWLQRIIYYLIVVSETAAVATLVIRPFLIYLIHEFFMCLSAVFVSVCVLAIALLCVDHRFRRRYT